MIGLDFKISKANFFDSDKIRDQLESKERRALSRVGSFVRRRMRSKIRKRKRPSKPGQPPSAHTTGFASLRTILFAYDQKQHSVVVGPVLLNKRQSLVEPVDGTVPGTLEAGGSIRIPEESYDGVKWYRINRRQKAPKKRIRVARVEPRPFSGASLEEEIEAGTIPAEWHGILN